MGAACSAKKKKEEEMPMEQVQQPKKNSKPKTLPPSTFETPTVELSKSNSEIRTRDLLLQYKKFLGMLDLIGDLDHLAPETRDRLNQLTILKSNINIIVQNNVKRALREQKIVKRVEEEDQKLVWNDQKFGVILSQHMGRIANLIQNELKTDENFEAAFPILIVSFVDLADQINEIIKKYEGFLLKKSYKKIIDSLVVQKEIKHVSAKKISNDSVQSNVRAHNKTIIQ